MPEESQPKNTGFVRATFSPVHALAHRAMSLARARATLPRHIQRAAGVVSILQSATGSGVTSGSGSSDAIAQVSANCGSFIDKLASEIADELLATYQQASGSARTPSQSSTGNQVKRPRKGGWLP